MRQVGDTLVWLAMIGVVAAVVYFTPRLASYVGCGASEPHRRRLHEHPPAGLPTTEKDALSTLGTFNSSRTQSRRPSA